MRDISIEGVGSVSGGEYNKISIEGVGSISDDIKAVEIYIEGVFNCNGRIESDFISCEGVATMNEAIRANRIDISGVMTLKEANLEAKTINCEGVIKSNAEISADKTVVDGCIKAAEIVGDEVIISHTPGRASRGIRKLFGISSENLSSIGLIEATTIRINDAKVKIVNGENITIGEYCEVDDIDCTGKLLIHPRAKVGRITGVTAEYSEEI
ncbi:hypothetical protein [Anaeromicropila herbilytica]|uniref:Polymer-forming protein n=1 Tax=Anaeromicropila herbilytica TaxID=2785025 RepID=A0A7R7EM14_9FIRM|nr:hypothetical protein [Anaeromicropila herbilytica]BCN31376.1 hypothetical protein bsdtb5_26710 [Anaeromicropila herbilytica]